MIEDALEEVKAPHVRVECGYLTIHVALAASLLCEEGGFQKIDERLLIYPVCHNLAAGGPQFGCVFVQLGHCLHRSLEVKEDNFYKPEE